MRLIIHSLIVTACVLYAFWGVDLSVLIVAVHKYDRFYFSLFPVYLLFSLIPLALRLSFLSGRRIGPFDAWKAVVLGFGLNNILPAKMGEFAKVNYLRTRGGISFGRGAEMVFWERFFDLNAVCLLGLAGMQLIGIRISVYPMAVVGLIWVCLAFFRLNPGLVERMFEYIPFQWLRKTAFDYFEALNRREKKFFLLLGIYSLVVWGGLAGGAFLSFNGVAGLKLSAGEVLTVYVVSTLCAAIPLSPGALGVYEAAVVASLGWFGIDREEALAVAVVLHLIQYILLTSCGLLVLAGSGLNLRRGKVVGPGDSS